eukprot:m.367016 g.367016  ORF g.367016 m.367016 type:complete len:277 (+) comp28097_c0_seq14:336-1166(+)
MPRWMADDVHLAVPQIMRVSGFPFMESGWNGDYILDMTIKDQVVYRRDGASVVVGLFPIVPTCIRRAHSGTAHWVIATTVGLAYTIASAEDDGGRAVIPDEAVWAKNITVLIRADMPSTLGGLAFPYPHSPGLPPQDDYLRLLTRMRRLGHLVMLSTSDDERIPAAFVRHRGARLTVLYSHGNGADIESCWDVARIFSKELKVNVLAYDYVGYSTSRLEGRAPSEKGCYRSIRAAFGYLIDDLKMTPTPLCGAGLLDAARARALCPLSLSPVPNAV